jgi:hypothetical protein
MMEVEGSDVGGGGGGGTGGSRATWARLRGSSDI